ncbi:MDR family MFS transporter [Anaerobacillus isosaccharinicus]|uniref:MFS transporter n=1 Tax=Anaerobacillus isosaccharinicus TaxID=1532552 RepID=A0A1S2MGQ7_9BACI|nr:MDR family MFS transporter [Anaerobacillus isosaccharinicus]MBA5588794.1 multidrug efflux MFS transporter [Anaerobacillus isosaccharinicus]QOY37811.1 multidrug efflux MFS transporter [Anaerobacillus isosaccharinicus]
MKKLLPEKWLVVIAVLLGTFTIILNNSMLNPAVPHLMNVFNADAVSTGWVITIFMVTMGITMPLTGYLGDKFGKKKLYLIGLLIFMVGSVLGSFSWNLSSLIFFRGIQGIAGGIMMPLSMALIFEVFPRHERGLATGIWGIAAMMAPTIGPTVGGVIIETGSWQWLFLFNVPIGLLGIIIGAMYLKNTNKVQGITFDRWGFASVTVGVGAILYALGRVSALEHLVQPFNLFLILIGFISLFFFVKIENRSEQPLLDLSIFKNKAYTYSVWISISTSLALFGGIFLIPLLIQHVYGLGPIVTGLIFLPAALFTGIFMTIGGRILDRRGPLLVVTSGLLITAIFTLSLGFITMETSLIVIFILMAMRGIGQGFSTMPATTAGMNAIPEKFISRGSAMNNVLRQISSALGIVFISIFYEVRKVQVFPNVGTMEEASLQAINEGFLLLGVIALLTVPFGWLLGRAAEKQESKTTLSA